MMEYTQMSFFDGAKHYKITKPIRLIELFAGIGAQAKALERIEANFEHYRICEFDKYAVRSYNAIHGTDFPTSGITKISASDLGIVDTDKYEYIMTYSFPCQDLSSAGKQKGMEKGSGTRSGLLWEVERLLRECTELPQVLLMENVPEVIGAKNIAHFADWIKFLESKGYKNYWQLLNAKDYGIPQNRNRCFMVSVLGDYYYNFPAKKKLTLPLEDMLVPYNEVPKSYFIDTSNKKIQILLEKTANRHISKTIRNGGRKSIDKHSWDIVFSIYSRPGKVDFIRGGLKSISRTLKSENNDAGITNLREARTYMPRECFRLMGFDDADFDRAQAVNSNSQLYKQAGNSIVVNVLEAIFRRML